MKMPCPRHSRDGKPANHSLENCTDLQRWKYHEVQKALRAQANGAGAGRGGNLPNGGNPPNGNPGAGNPGNGQNEEDQGDTMKTPRD